MSSITPFKINVPEERLQRLQQKLALTDFPDEITNLEPDELWSRGAPLSDVKRLVAYWQSGFNWRKSEAALNKFPQYTTDIEVEGFGSYQVHFVHQTSGAAEAIPLLFLHGWPGSFIEVTKILPLLVQGEDQTPCFHVVGPSLIDFGFSSPSKKKGFSMDQHAEVYHKLMLALGYDQYVVQSGDMGCLVSRSIAAKYGPKHCTACHTNSAVPAEPTAESHPELYAKLQATPLSDFDKAGLERTARFSKQGNGYYQEQSTKPQTIGYSLTDSPVGLLSWLFEKLHDWADAYPWTDDEILTWVSIHYFSKAGPAAPSHLYYAMEHSSPGAFAASQRYVDVPLGIARFAKDLIMLPKLWNHTLSPIVLQSEYAQGGHFAAWERPDDIVKDLRIMFRKGNLNKITP
ncbi:Alpha/Beta hydrolase protein [Xylariales sp. PMI_506]|nr:Alpha/Beta hydrolase protein [Xylariales sp. PMI_506]